MHKIFSFTSSNLSNYFASSYSKGKYHAKHLLKHLYSTGSLESLEKSEGFLANPRFAKVLQEDFYFTLPKIISKIEYDGLIKFSMELNDGLAIESVIIPMKTYNTLCVSSQVGCKMGCSFCRTAKMGFYRNLEAYEIVLQYFIARFVFNKNIQNIVFMGMGEPIDNLKNVLLSIDILTDINCAALLKRRISLSTCGYLKGFTDFTSEIKNKPHKNYHLLTLSISLHSANNKKRSELMKINNHCDLVKLKDALVLYTKLAPKSKIYFEYLVIPNVNDSENDAVELANYIKDLPAKVNLIPHYCCPENQSIYKNATSENIDNFWKKLNNLNVKVYSRKSKGEKVLASCGQLSTQLN